MNELWKQAQKLAEENYEKEYGACTWDDADKYEREDWVFAEYEKLGGFELDKKKQQLEEARKEFRKHKMPEILNADNYTEWHNLHKEMHDKLAHKIFELEKEIKEMAQARDCKGRFTSKTTEYGNANTNSNMKGNDTMNKTNTKTNRMETLKANGIDTTNFFDLSMRVPFGAEVKILVNGQEMIIPATGITTATAYGNHVVGNGLVGNFVGVPTVFSSNGDICNAETGEVLIMANDPIAQSIIEDGYVRHPKLFRRWILPIYIGMLEYVDRKNPNRKGWEACMKDCYSYGYQFEMLKDELHTLAKLQKEDPEYFAERTKFFNGDVVVATLNDYLYRLKKYCEKQTKEHPRKYSNQPYCKLARYGNVLVKDLDAKVYLPIQYAIEDIKAASDRNDYYVLERLFNDFMSRLYNKLPYETPKCAAWKDAFKGAGAYYSLQNMCRWHNVVLRGAVGKYDSEGCLKELLNGEFKNEVWRFHNLLVDTIEYNKFDLRKSIAEGHSAPNTVSQRANAYRR